jgi:hypothetical protein
MMHKIAVSREGCSVIQGNGLGHWVNGVNGLGRGLVGPVWVAVVGLVVLPWRGGRGPSRAGPGTRGARAGGVLRGVAALAGERSG